MFNYFDLNTLHLEITSNCNASCPMCARNINGGALNPNLPAGEIYLEDVKKWFPTELVKRLRKIYACGNYGDPAAGKETLEIFKYFRSINPKIYLGLHSNGSIRSKEWWRQLAETVDYCRFGIDGLEDTNHLYRRNTSWKKIMENASAFIQAKGGSAQWDYIVFRHNEHQIEQARALAHEMGFQQFNYKKTARFFSQTQLAKKERREVLSAQGEVEYYLEMPKGAEFQNSAIAFFDKKSSTDTEDYFKSTPITCKTSKEKSIYITAQGLAFPCCWTGGKLFQSFESREAQELRALVESDPGGLGSLSLHENSLCAILENSPLFGLALRESLKCGSSSRLRVCERVCGEIDAFQNQFESKVQAPIKNL